MKSNLILGGVIALALTLVASLAVSAETSLEQGVRLANQGDVDAALAAYQQAVAEQPESSLAHSRLGGAYLLKQQHAEAIEAFQTAIGLDAENGAAFLGMGMAYLHRAQYSLARAALEQAKELKPAQAGEIDQVLTWMAEREGGQALQLGAMTHP